MEKTNLDNQVQQCAGSYKPARGHSIQIYELNKKMIVLNSWTKLNQITEQWNRWRNLSLTTKEDCLSVLKNKCLSTIAKEYPKLNPLVLQMSLAL